VKRANLTPLICTEVVPSFWGCPSDADLPLRPGARRGGRAKSCDFLLTLTYIGVATADDLNSLQPTSEEQRVQRRTRWSLCGPELSVRVTWQFDVEGKDRHGLSSSRQRRPRRISWVVAVKCGYWIKAIALPVRPGSLGDKVVAPLEALPPCTSGRGTRHNVKGGCSVPCG
jgi:hypothetical protein